MFKRIFCYCLAAVVIISGCYTLHAWTQQHQLSEKLIRLHVIANSDSKQDQEQKLLVRDAVLSQAQKITSGAQTVGQASSRLKNNLPLLQHAAEETLRNAGNAQSVSVTLTKEKYATRYYDTFTLPAGTYLSLRVSIGSAAGHNWWCVVFPSLCTSATTEELWQNAEAASFTDEETEQITSGESKYILKFKTLELLQKLLSKLS